jgi:hypothetical protein
VAKLSAKTAKCNHNFVFVMIINVLSGKKARLLPL